MPLTSTMESPQTPPTAAVNDGDYESTGVTFSVISNERETDFGHANDSKDELEHAASEDISSDDETSNCGSPNLHPESDAEDEDEEEDEEGDEEDEHITKKQKQLSELPKGDSSDAGTSVMPSGADTDAHLPLADGKPAHAAKKPKKKSKDVWTTTSRKGKKKIKNISGNGKNSKVVIGDPSVEDKVLITPISKFPEKIDDSPELEICLSKVYKAEKVELSEDRLSAGSIKGYRMVRATRGVSEGAWYFEIKVVHLGETGHTRLGWSTDKGDLQAPVGYDGNSFGYRDIDGCKLHKALREPYGDEGYKEGDVIGFYINLPDGGSYAPDPQRMVWYKGQRYARVPDAKGDSPKVVPGSEMCFFKNGVCQGVAFTGLIGGHYYPAASMYTLPNQPNCVVKFNFGPDFECFPEDFGEHPAPKPMIEVPYQGYDSRVAFGVINEKKE